MRKVLWSVDCKLIKRGRNDGSASCSFRLRMCYWVAVLSDCKRGVFVMYVWDTHTHTHTYTHTHTHTQTHTHTHTHTHSKKNKKQTKNGWRSFWAITRLHQSFWTSVLLAVTPCLRFGSCIACRRRFSRPPHIKFDKIVKVSLKPLWQRRQI